MTIIIQLPRDIVPSLASEIEKESVFVSPFLAQLKVTPEMDSVAVELSDPTQESAVREKLDRHRVHDGRQRGVDLGYLHDGLGEFGDIGGLTVHEGHHRRSPGADLPHRRDHPRPVFVVGHYREYRRFRRQQCKGP